MKRLILVILILLITVTAAFSQELRIVVSAQPLDEVLKGLGLELSFDDQALSRYNITVHKTFQSPQAAIEFLLKNTPYVCQRIGKVYVISPKPKEKKSPLPIKPTYKIQGKIRDALTGESLPLAYITSDRGTITSNANGLFNLTVSEKKAINLKISYLGYESVDTLLNIGNCDIQLQPKSIMIDDIIVTSTPTAMLMQSGATSGEVRINHAIAQYLPGGVDNSIFTLLRMMPGVKASGEPSADLIVWGSGAGESQIRFDGFTLLGLKNFNDNISSVNPYMVKDIQLMKGGYGGNYGNCIGAIANIRGIDGQRNKPTIKANISNLTANTFASLPITKRSSLSAAYRQTYYNLYDSQNLNPYGKNTSNGKGKGNQNQKVTDIYVQPDYAFRDGNLKYSGEAADNDSYYVSLYTAHDKFDFSMIREDKYAIDAAETNRQYGGAAAYNKVWTTGANTNLSFSFSQLHTSIDRIQGINGNQQQSKSLVHTDNRIQESTISLNHTFNIGKKHTIELGGEWMHYASTLNKAKTLLSKPTLYLTNNILLGKLSLNAGVRADFPVKHKTYIQPRLSAKYSITEELSATASWGMYNQYISRLPFIDETGSYQFAWQIMNKPMTSMHTVGGLAYSKNGFLISLEGYAKQIDNAIRLNKDSAYSNRVQCVGSDLFFKKEIRTNTLFASYSIVGIREQSTKVAHEIKLGGVVSLSPFHLSANYVYGTGFANLSALGQGKGQGLGNIIAQTDKSYNRFDVAATYRLKIKNSVLQTGVSVLNIFDTQNIKYSDQLSNKKDVTNIYTQAIRFTPMIFVEILF